MIKPSNYTTEKTSFRLGAPGIMTNQVFLISDYIMVSS